ncbi:ABC transporter substrate-binding protein [Mameliella alba]|nr:extracellular solute-binding protein [Mameliella alba]
MDASQDLTQYCAQREEDMKLHKTIGRIAGAAAVTAALATGGQAQSVEDLVEGAREEGRLVVMMLHPTNSANRDRLIEAFKAEYDLDIDIEWAPTHPTALMGRLNAESASGTFSGDVGQGSVDDLWPSVEKGYVAKFDWVDAFGDSLPGIKSATEGVPPEMEDTVLSMFDLVYGLIWNPHFVEESELPVNVADLTDPKWDGKIALNSYHIAPVDYLNYEIGEEETVEIVEGLLANGPILKAGSGAVGAAVSAGEAAVGTGMAYAADLAVARGEPIRFRPFADYTPVLGMKTFVPEYAPNPNAARLFAAWFVTKGIAMVGEEERIGQLSNPDSVVGAELKQQIDASGSAIVSVSSIKQFEQLAKTRKVIDQMIANQ